MGPDCREGRATSALTTCAYENAARELEKAIRERWHASAAVTLAA
jgi:hypothetical protein